MKFSKVLSFVLSVAMLLTLLTIGFAIPASADGPEAISTADDFLQMSKNGSYYLANDLVITKEWGDSATTFDGTFDGRGHTITISDCPVFFYLGGTAVVKNLTIEGSITRAAYASALAQHTSGGSWFGIRIQNVTNNATVTATDTWGYAGGLIADGFVANSDCWITLMNCTNNGNVNCPSQSAVGGLIGSLRGGTLTMINCINTGNVVGKQDAGGLVGRFWKDGKATIQNCLNTGSVANSTNMYAGGAVGWLHGTLTLSNFTNIGAITSSSGAMGAGGFLGGAHKNEDDKVFNATITKCLNEGTISGGGSIGAFVGSNNGAATTCVLNISECIDKSENANLLGEQKAEQTTLDTSKPEAEIERLGFQELPKPGEKPALSGGSGTQSDPYLLSTVDDLISFSTTVGIGDAYQDVYLKLTTDIDLENSDLFSPIGNEFYTFSGIFDGAGHTVSGIHIAVTGGEVAGFFGAISGATVKNLNVEGDLIQSDYVAGAIAGCAFEGSKIIDCSSKIDAIKGRQCGGIVGSVQGSGSNWNYIIGCESKSAIASLAGTTDHSHGGIAGIASGSVLFGCVNSGNILAEITDGSAIGGIVGSMKQDGYLIGCVNNGAVSAYSTEADIKIYAGGIVGKANGLLYRCVNTGNVSAIIGENVQSVFAGISAIIPIDSYAYIDLCVNTASVANFPENLCEDDSAFVVNGEPGCSSTLENFMIREADLIDALNRMSTMSKFSEKKIGIFTEKCNGDYYGYVCTTIAERMQISGTVELVNFSNGTCTVNSSVCDTLSSSVSEIIRLISVVQNEVDDMPTPKKDDSTTMTEAPTTEAPTTEAPTTEAPAKKKGCRSSVATTPVILLAVLPLAVVFCKKKKESEV